MSGSVVKVGRLSLVESEDNEVSEAQDRVVEISGIESAAGSPALLVKKVHSDILGLVGALVPVVFQDKTMLNGYYYIQDAKDAITYWKQGVANQQWSLHLDRIGEAQEIDLESRLNGAQSRVNDFSIVGVRWHSPPGGHSAYYTGATVASSLVRSGTEGNQTFYYGLPLNLYPRWACDLANYPNGRCRFIDSGFRERSGISFENSPNGWTISNGIISVAMALSTGVFTVNGKDWDVLVNAVSLGRAPISCTLIRNDYECVIARLTWSPRAQVDLTLRRGSRFIELYIQYPYSSTIKIVRAVTEAATDVPASGYLRATSNDASGNRYVIGTLKTYTPDVAVGGISKSSVVAMDCWIGIEQAGTGAIVGDTALDLQKQYVGISSERVIGYRR